MYDYVLCRACTYCTNHCVSVYLFTSVPWFIKPWAQTPNTEPWMLLSHIPASLLCDWSTVQCRHGKWTTAWRAEGLEVGISSAFLQPLFQPGDRDDCKGATDQHACSKQTEPKKRVWPTSTLLRNASQECVTSSWAGGFGGCGWLGARLCRRPRLPNKSPQPSKKGLAPSPSSLPASLRLTTVVINIAIITIIIGNSSIRGTTVLLFLLTVFVVNYFCATYSYLTHKCNNETGEEKVLKTHYPNYGTSQSRWYTGDFNFELCN